MSTKYEPNQKIEHAFQQAKQDGNPVFIPFIMAGYPSYQLTIEIALQLESEGAQVLELGFPYSDPLADGPIIQEAASFALEQGFTFAQGLQLIEDLRMAGLTIPIIIFSYYNPILQYGLESFVQKAISVGANGVLAPDLPYEEASPLQELCRQYHFGFISLVAPTSAKRIEAISRQAEGFLYCISSLGVTGIRDHFSDDMEAFLEQVKTHALIPLAVGFGVSNKSQVQYLAQHVAGIIIGSAIIKNISANLDLYLHPSSKNKALGNLKLFVHDLFSS